MSGSSDEHILIRSGQLHMHELLCDRTRRRFRQLRFSWSLLAADVRFGVFFAPDGVPASSLRSIQFTGGKAEYPAGVFPILPMCVWSATAQQAVAQLDIPWNAQGTLVLVWDNRAARFSDKRLRSRCSFAYGDDDDDDGDGGGAARVESSPDLLGLPPPVWEQVLSGEILVGRREVARLPLILLPEFARQRHQLQWEFALGDDSVEFAITFMPVVLNLPMQSIHAEGSAPTAEVIHSPERVAARAGTVAGTLALPSPAAGTYTFLWDNSASMLFAKRVTFTVKLIRV